MCPISNLAGILTLSEPAHRKSLTLLPPVPSPPKPAANPDTAPGVPATNARLNSSSAGRF